MQRLIALLIPLLGRLLRAINGKGAAKFVDLHDVRDDAAFGECCDKPCTRYGGCRQRDESRPAPCPDLRDLAALALVPFAPGRQIRIGVVLSVNCCHWF